LIVEQGEHPLDVGLFDGPAVGALHECSQQAFTVFASVFRLDFHGRLRQPSATPTTSKPASTAAPPAGESSSTGPGAILSTICRPAALAAAGQRRRADFNRHTRLARLDALHRQVAK
jgi:hypothetical protein